MGPIADQIACDLRLAAAADHPPQPASVQDLVEDLLRVVSPAGLKSVEAFGNRLIVDVQQPALVSLNLFRSPSIRGLAQAPGNSLHILLDRPAEGLDARMFEEVGNYVHGAVPG